MNASTAVTVCPLFAALAMMTAVAGTSASDESRALFVRNNGVDSATCGEPQNACRSISQAIENGANGDTIWVGAGRYGDLNRDSDFDDPGEEHLNTAENCLVCISKSLRVFSIHGPDFTVIDATTDIPVNGPTGPSVVAILANDVMFGGKKRGFTLTGGTALGALVANQVDNVRVVGNVARRNAFNGFLFNPPGRSLLISHNRAIDTGGAISGNGFVVFGGTDGVVLHRNTAEGNGGVGFRIVGTVEHLVSENIANANGSGFAIGGHGMLIKNNAATNNTADGFGISGATQTDTRGNRFVGNTVIGNRNSGFFITSTARNTVIRGNNIYGNGGFGFTTDAGSELNCGIVTLEARAVAANNFWGAATGPGNDPADDAGPDSGCDREGGVTVIEPFATTPFPINP